MPAAIDAALNPAEIASLHTRDLSQTVCVVFDVLRATSSLVTALAGGAAAVYPVETIEEALRLRKAIPGALLGGERQGVRIEGFDLANSPLEYLSLRGKTVVSTTTNGTVALCAAAGAKELLAAALLNLGATARRLYRHPDNPLLLLCAGTFETAALEDILAAGALIEAAAAGNTPLTDSAQTARAVYQRWQHDLRAGLESSRNGRHLCRTGEGAADVAHAARRDLYDVVAVAERDGGGRLRLRSLDGG